MDLTAYKKSQSWEVQTGEMWKDGCSSGRGILARGFQTLIWTPFLLKNIEENGRRNVQLIYLEERVQE